MSEVNFTASDDVIKMPLGEFELQFGFKPKDALEKYHFAVTGNRLAPIVRDAIESGVIGDVSLEDVVMG